MLTQQEFRDGSVSPSFPFLSERFNCGYLVPVSLANTG